MIAPGRNLTRSNIGTRVAALQKLAAVAIKFANNIKAGDKNGGCSPFGNDVTARNHVWQIAEAVGLLNNGHQAATIRRLGKNLLRWMVNDLALQGSYPPEEWAKTSDDLYNTVATIWKQALKGLQVMKQRIPSELRDFPDV